MDDIRKTYDIVGSAGDATHPVYWHIHTLWQSDDEGLLREFHSTHTKLDKAEDVVRERLILVGHRPKVAALAANMIAKRALGVYFEKLKNADQLDRDLEDILNAAEEEKGDEE